MIRSIRVAHALVRAASAFLSTLAGRPPEARLRQRSRHAPRGPEGSFLRTVQRRRREPLPGLPGAFSRRAYLLALRRRPGAADAAGGEGLAIASGSPAGAGRRRRGAGTRACHRGARHPKHREWRGVTVARRVVEDWLGVVILLLVAAAVGRSADIRRRTAIGPHHLSPGPPAVPCHSSCPPARRPRATPLAHRPAARHPPPPRLLRPPRATPAPLLLPPAADRNPARCTTCPRSRRATP